MDELRYDTAPPVVVTSPVHATPSIILHAPKAGKKKESLGWMTSVLVHAVFIVLIALLLVPAHFGDAAKQVILLSLSDGDAEDQGAATLELSPMDSAESIESAELTAAVDIIPKLVVAGLAHLGSGTGSGASGNQSDGGGPRGSFFGIQADGHEFVYVLDVSGSMRGARYVRAAAELVKSVNELRPSQRFYVVLFNGSTTQLFGESTVLPTSVVASRENKSRLEQWLYQIEPNGSTDPRQALHLALRMNPSVVFMLSDGEFTDKRKRADRGMFRDNADTYAVVEATGTDVAVNAIAFEDPRSCGNMQRLATMTSGQYRFVKESNDAPDVLIAEAQAAKAAGNYSVAESLLRHVLATASQADATNRARVELTSMRTESSNQALESNDLDRIIDALQCLVKDDPNAETSIEIQDSLIAAIHRLTRSQDDEPIGSSEDSEVVRFVRSYSNSYAGMKFLEPQESTVLEESMALEADGKLLEAYSTLHLFTTKHSLSMPSARCNAARIRISEKLFEQGEAIQRSEGADASVSYLQDIVNRSRGTALAKSAKLKQKTLLFQWMSELRDAKMKRDHKHTFRLQAEIASAFLGVDDYLTMKNEFLKNEVTAKTQLREAQERDRASSVNDAERCYVSITETFPYTLAAQTSRERLREMGFERETTAGEQNIASIDTLIIE